MSRIRPWANGDQVVLTDTGSVPVSAGLQSPLPVNADSVYTSDLWISESVVAGWVDLDGAGGDLIPILFNNLHTAIQNTSADNPKVLSVHFNRTVFLNQVGIGCANHVGDSFSNVLVRVLGSGGVEREVFNDSANSTKLTSNNYQFGPELCNALQLEFYTADPITLTNLTIQKLTSTSSILRATEPNGSIIDIGATESGNLKVSDAESGLAIAKGLVKGNTFIHKFGGAPDFATADGPVTIWDGADAGGIDEMTYTYSTTAAIDSLSSSSTTDLTSIEVQGLDANYALVIQTITLAGQVLVALTTPLLRVFRLKNVGNVDLTGYVYCYENTALSGGVPVDTAKVRAIIQLPNNQTLMAVYTVPAGCTGYMRDWYAATAGASKSSNYPVRLLARPFGQVFQLKHVAALSDGGTSQVQHRYEEPEVFAEKTDIELRVAVLATGASGAAVAGGFDIVLADNV